MAHLDDTSFAAHSLMPSEDVAVLRASQPGFLDAGYSEMQARVEAKLRKRYAIPFDPDNVPEIVLGWEARLFTPRAYFKRGVNPSDAIFQACVDDAKQAWDEVTEAANSETGLFDLPLRTGEDPTAISKGGPLGYSEASPYTWIDVQLEAVGDE